MKQIEFFGVSNSGKSYLVNYLIKKNLYKKEIYSYKGVIYKFLINEEKNILKKIILKYYLLYKFHKTKKNYYTSSHLFKNKNTKTNLLNFSIFKKFIFDIYWKNIQKVFLKSKNNELKKLVFKFIKNSNFSDNNKNIFRRWFIEEMAAKYLIKKNFLKIKYVIDSEGFVQRLFIYTYKKKNKSKLINDYLKLCFLPDKIFYTSLKRYKIKSFFNSEFNLDFDEQKKIYFKVLKTLKKKINTEFINEKRIKKILL